MNNAVGNVNDNNGAVAVAVGRFTKFYSILCPAECKNSAKKNQLVV